MDTKELIAMLNRDLADEHAAVLRYLVHSYIEGEDTPIGANLLSRSREEMWHMHWLGMIIGQLGGEPDLTPAEYPFDPTSRATILQSYVKYEQDLIPHYNSEADRVNDPHIKRVLRREAWESEIHARKFKRLLSKLSPEQADGLPGEEPEMDMALLDQLQAEVMDKYTEMLQHIRQSWVFQIEGRLAWDLMDQAMAKMKQLAHFAEDVAENGMEPRFKAGVVDFHTDLAKSLNSSLELLQNARVRHQKLSQEEEVKKHAGLVINLDLTLQQEEFQAEELKDTLSKQPS